MATGGQHIDTGTHITSGPPVRLEDLDVARPVTPPPGGRMVVMGRWLPPTEPAEAPQDPAAGAAAVVAILTGIAQQRAAQAARRGRYGR